MIEDVLNHRNKTQILNYLSKKEWVTRAHLNLKVGSNWPYLNKYLQSLINENILAKKTFGSHTIYGYADTNKAQYLKNFFIKWRNMDALSTN